jgi:hypothetical protein
MRVAAASASPGAFTSSASDAFARQGKRLQPVATVGAGGRPARCDHHSMMSSPQRIMSLAVSVSSQSAMRRAAALLTSSSNR